MEFNPAHFNLLLISFLSFSYFIYVSLISLFNPRKAGRKLTVGLFHPYCNAGGGGERVLWAALRSLQTKYPDYQFVVYTGDINVTAGEMIENAKSRFNILLNPNNIKFIYLKSRTWVEAEKYPSFTLIGQSIGSIYMGLEALAAYKPDIFIETMGYAFTLPLFKFVAGCQVGCYVHYPTISTDMLQKVSSRSKSFNNQSTVASSHLLSSAKLIYYKLFASLYSVVGRASDVIMVNSSWTQNHINKLWQRPTRTKKVYPPCDVKDFKTIPLPDKDSEEKSEEFRILSVAQFRPEKDHALQLKALNKLRKVANAKDWEKVKLVLIGSVRNDGDAERVKALEDLRDELNLADHVEFRLNVSFVELKKELGNGLIGIHTMWNEHFGISIVECMAAGLIMIAHKSGGPMMDIVIQDEGYRNGFLAAEEDEYAAVIQRILALSPTERSEIRSRARESVDRFSDQEFSKGFLRAVAPLFL